MFLYSIRNRLKTRKVFDSLEMRACVPDRFNFKTFYYYSFSSYSYYLIVNQ